MEIGGVTVFGLPDELPIWIDARVMQRDRIVLGGGSRSWKVVASPEILLALPNVEVVHMETPTPINALGAKGIGESGTIGSTPAVQSAVIDAVSHLGVRHIDMPATAEKVWRAIQAAG